jgi:hypothetical protein
MFLARLGPESLAANQIDHDLNNNRASTNQVETQRMVSLLQSGFPCHENLDIVTSPSQGPLHRPIICEFQADLLERDRVPAR